MSAESGLSTFRDSDGLWEQYPLHEVATPTAWNKNPALVLEFYNKRRRQIALAKPNAAHVALAELESAFEVHVITQNIDDLHERAGSRNVLHLHGHIFYAKTEELSTDLVAVRDDLVLGHVGPDGKQLRPHVVWFGESVPEMNRAAELVSRADVLLVIGTSLNVYPAASLVYQCSADCALYLIDPAAVNHGETERFIHLKNTAVAAVPPLVKQLLMERGKRVEK